jgi:acetyl-CoA acetyltransferase
MTLDGLFCSIDQLGMGEATERYNANYKLTRVDQDKFSAESHKRAAAATTAGVQLKPSSLDKVTAIGICATSTAKAGRIKKSLANLFQVLFQAETCKK